MKRSTFLWIFPVLLLPNLAGAQDAPRAKKAKPATAKITAPAPLPDPLLQYSQEPLDPSIDQLPTNFKGHSCKAIAKKLKTFSPEKDEFETSAAHSQRLAHVSTEILYGGLSGSSTLAFSPDRPLLIEKYDADSGNMSITYLALGSRSVKVGANYVMSAVIDSKVTDSEEYVGANGYGRKVTIKRLRHDVCGISFGNIGSIRGHEKLPKDFSFKLSAEEAKASKGNIGVLYIVAPSIPYATRYSDYAAPTMDSPTELFFGGDTIIVRLSQVWLFDKNSGRIFAKSEI